MITSTLEYPMGPGFFIFFGSVDDDPGGGQISRIKARGTSSVSVLGDDPDKNDEAIAIALLLAEF